MCLGNTTLNTHEINKINSQNKNRGIISLNMSKKYGGLGRNTDHTLCVDMCMYVFFLFP